jgi:hypothetical protein
VTLTLTLTNITVQFLSECGGMQFAVRFRSVCEDVKNGILASKDYNCVNAQKRKK